MYFPGFIVMATDLGATEVCQIDCPVGRDHREVVHLPFSECQYDSQAEW